jgi:hypothetical protein
MSQDVDVRELLGLAVNCDEPPHRYDAEGSISRGDAARRRSRFVRMGTTLSVAAMVSGFVFLNAALGGSGSTPGSPADRQPLVFNPEVWDKQADIDMNMPTLFSRVLPDGPKLKFVPSDSEMVSGDFKSDSGTFRATGPDGTDSVELSPFNLPAADYCGDKVWPRAAGSIDTCTPTAVSGGTVYVWSYIEPAGTTDSNGGKTRSTRSDFSYVYIPEDKTQRTFQALILNVVGDHPQLTAQQFVAMVGKPGFDEMTALVDPGVKPSAAASARRVAIDADIARTMGSVLPAGFLLELTTTTLSQSLELVSPGGGISGVQWQRNVGTGPTLSEQCAAHRADYSECVQTTVPGGTLVQAHFDRGDIGSVQHWTGYTFIPDDGSPKIGVDLYDVTSTPELAAGQFLVIARAPGIAQKLADVISMSSTPVP